MLGDLWAGVGWQEGERRKDRKRRRKGKKRKEGKEEGRKEGTPAQGQNVIQSSASWGIPTWLPPSGGVSKRWLFWVAA